MQRNLLITAGLGVAAYYLYRLYKHPARPDLTEPVGYGPTARGWHGLAVPGSCLGVSTEPWNNNPPNQRNPCKDTAQRWKTIVPSHAQCNQAFNSTNNDYLPTQVGGYTGCALNGEGVIQFIKTNW